MSTENSPELNPIDRAQMDVDIACVGFGPAMGGFLSTLSRGLLNEDGTPAVESAAMPGMPPQVVCYERADDTGFGVSGVVTKGRAVRASYPELAGEGLAAVPMAAPVGDEKVLYLLDPLDGQPGPDGQRRNGPSRRPALMRLADKAVRAFGWMLPFRDHALSLPWTPAFLHKRPGMVLSMGQFMQWVSAQVQMTGLVQVWPGTPVSEVLLEGQNEADSAAKSARKKVVGVRLLDQGVDKNGVPGDGFMPGMDIRAALTVIGDGPVGAIGQQLDAELGLPDGHKIRDWAVGMKFVVDLPEGTALKPGTVLHTFGYPEPEIFGFLYVHPENVASLGIFVPSWFDSPVRTAYRYLQHWMLHPYLWKLLEGGRLRSWGAKTLGESGLHGEPQLTGDGFARIGEGSGTTNVLTGSGVDEAWATGTQLAEGVLELLKSGKPFTKENLDAAYVARRRASWVEAEGRVAEKSRNGFQSGFIPGVIGMGLTGITNGLIAPGGLPVPPWKRIPTVEDYYKGVIPAEEIEAIRKECAAKSLPLHGALMERAGWPAIPYEGQLLVSHQDALLIGGKVQAPPGYADHVRFKNPDICATCREKVCIEACSGQAIAPGEDGGLPAFDREKCVHCGACLWNCSKGILPNDEDSMNVAFCAGTGGLHSAEN